MDNIVVPCFFDSSQNISVVPLMQ